MRGHHCRYWAEQAGDEASASGGSWLSSSSYSGVTGSVSMGLNVSAAQGTFM